MQCKQGARGGRLRAAAIKTTRRKSRTSSPMPRRNGIRRPSPIEEQCGGVAAEYAECTVCFEPLCDDRCCTLHRGGNRVCRHLIHQKCAEAMQCAGRFNCPECRGQFDTLQPLPVLDKSNAREWFNAVDVDGDKRLDRNEVVTVLKAQYRLDWRKLEEHLDTLWQRWDQDGSGDLAYEELFAPDGLIAYITGDVVAAQFAPQPTMPSGEVPELSDAPAWFKYWDTDGNGQLDQQEVQRALMKTFRLGSEMHRVHTMRETLDTVWPLFDHDGNGEIDFGEFTSHNGLGETLALSVKMMDTPAKPPAQQPWRYACAPVPAVRRLASQTYVGQQVWTV